ncbi:MAG: acetylornithine deacetylase/succinyl-diaminopimelate desuccinylase family protein [Vicinamibacterales bacterium]|mgnify:CR=1 FL=1|nr:succinyl-diaminopimelate desuccinylase [Acidobacteriota bacterium]MDP7294231.1 acetylornithine deacetylase/succinyl-diaminopimelate desuccinylase family protein [Vicinamibacterales bacterium]MDP7672032.1 acetylornithine deacetylase/succinyl-diaminopimelate desuccinylase family protein [Vicinamibacterales bacterium]HJO39213.1 acetylornithine deacetylase/succinyl-diaminopimelate desuccinylase family protein [Vicinamibacterales bacterium]
MPTPQQLDRVLREVDAAADPLVEFTATLVRIPTVNPPGDHYADCASVIGDRLTTLGFEVEQIEATGRPEHTPAHPRVNVVGRREGRTARPLLHLNGHFDVVPAGEGWTVDPFAGVVRDGRLYGRGSADMKAGLAAAIYAADAVRRAGVDLTGTLEVSGTVDEESGGMAGVAWLAEHGRLAASRTDFVIIPEPFGVDRICLGHRGVYWFDVVTHGRTAHGSMPFLGESAIDAMSRVLDAVRDELTPLLSTRVTAMPVVPAGARRPSINVNGLFGGQGDAVGQTPCVADRCLATFDRRFLIEEGFDATRAEVVALLERAAARDPGFQYDLVDRLVVHPVQAAADAPLVTAIEAAVVEVTGDSASRVASPGTYDQKHVARLAGVEQCVAYGPGTLELAHQPDEYCAVDDLIAATKVMALAIVRLVG